MKELMFKTKIETMNEGTVVITIEKELNKYYDLGIGRKYNYTVEASNSENSKYYQSLIFEIKFYKNEANAMKCYNNFKRRYFGYTKEAHDQQVKIMKLMEEKFGKLEE